MHAVLNRLRIGCFGRSIPPLLLCSSIGEAGASMMDFATIASCPHSTTTISAWRRARAQCPTNTSVVATGGLRGQSGNAEPAPTTRAWCVDGLSDTRHTSATLRRAALKRSHALGAMTRSGTEHPHFLCRAACRDLQSSARLLNCRSGLQMFAGATYAHPTVIPPLSQTPEGKLGGKDQFLDRRDAAERHVRSLVATSHRRREAALGGLGLEDFPLHKPQLKFKGDSQRATIDN